jgi:hypothetical protein
MAVRLVDPTGITLTTIKIRIIDRTGPTTGRVFLGPGFITYESATLPADS